MNHQCAIRTLHGSNTARIQSLEKPGTKRLPLGNLYALLLSAIKDITPAKRQAYKSSHKCTAVDRLKTLQV